MNDTTATTDGVAPFVRPRNRRTRIVLAAAALLLPAGAVLLTRLAWTNDLPEQLAFHWDASGAPDGLFPTAPLFWMTSIGSVLLFGIGVLVLLVPSRDREDTRKSVTIAGSVAAFIAAAWVVPAGATFSAGSVEHASLGAWPLLFVAALAYGALPRLLMPRA